MCSRLTFFPPFLLFFSVHYNPEADNRWVRGEEGWCGKVGGEPSVQLWAWLRRRQDGVKRRVEEGFFFSRRFVCV